VRVGLAALPRLAEGERVLVRVRVRAKARVRLTGRGRVRVRLRLRLNRNLRLRLRLRLRHRPRLRLRQRPRLRVRVRARVTSFAGGGFHPVHTASTVVSHLVRVGARARVRAGARTRTRPGSRPRARVRSPVRARGKGRAHVASGSEQAVSLRQCRVRPAADASSRVACASSDAVSVQRSSCRLHEAG
jgi:hypothetical protein